MRAGRLGQHAIHVHAGILRNDNRQQGGVSRQAAEGRGFGPARQRVLRRVWGKLRQVHVGGGGNLPGLRRRRQYGRRFRGRGWRGRCCCGIGLCRCELRLDALAADNHAVIGTGHDAATAGAGIARVTRRIAGIPAGAVARPAAAYVRAVIAVRIGGVVAVAIPAVITTAPVPPASLRGLADNVNPATTKAATNKHFFHKGRNIGQVLRNYKKSNTVPNKPNQNSLEHISFPR